ncbi:deoxynucleoside triphosphate triphosphohydrolase SAMHD1-like isoform X1 [Hemibagrus wyckioides]|uniref:deoxynucleoside triphosphate triphosphohydrolase SAMHD1-like isoform X1 n=1 Tax=Hemibagrus wyckioides TaxID=337641 RepID=UPI00266D5D33|nr:deoxynucleoside triphosphate triphosphohydrolase SAMHD1-like isoform X1 [Hemibagrus wyckioides]
MCEIPSSVLRKCSDLDQNMKRTYKALESGQNMDTETYKIFNDSVHGHIKMHPLLVKIIDTPEFQRLRNIKQLGGGYFVFPGASHNRFEHSIGVAHLAGELVRSLRAQESTITDKDELCVQIAGLCHDLGHGPFSHAFEIFMKEAKPDLKWGHEKASVEMFERLITNNQKDGKMIEEIMKGYGFNNQDIVFIEELIYGTNPPTKRSEQLQALDSKWPYKGRQKEKSYLYEIVANKNTGIDVDKMDYFSRDCLHLGMKSNFSHERYMNFARVCTIKDDKDPNINGQKMICMRDKEALNMYEIFHVRYLLHHNAYHHRVTKAVEWMIIDAFLEAEKEDFKLDGKKISETVSDLSIYMKLTDNILDKIKRETQKAKKIIEKIERRELYRFVGGTVFKAEEKLQEWKKKLKECFKNPDYPEKDFRVIEININYGQNEKNPIDSLWFYRKDDVKKGIKLNEDEVSYIKPAIFQETKVFLLYMKSSPPCLNDEQLGTFWKMIKNK